VKPYRWRMPNGCVEKKTVKVVIQLDDKALLSVPASGVRLVSRDRTPNTTANEDDIFKFELFIEASLHS
jgi:hypothetical protein